MLIDPAAYEHITGPVIAAAIEVHRHLGAGLLESAYAPCLEFELALRKVRFQKQRAIPVEAVLPVHRSQVLTYLKLTDCPVGLVINFNVPLLTDGVKRVLNPAATPREKT